MRIRQSFGSVTVAKRHKPGLRHLGIPPSGPFDAEYFRILETLLRQTKAGDFEALELANASVELEFPLPGTVAIVGAPVSAQSDVPDCATNGRFPVTSGSSIRITAGTTGLRTYVAFTPLLLRATRLSRVPGSVECSAIRVIPGPQFSAGDWPLESLTVSQIQDRVGVRCQPVESWAHHLELPSEPAVFGAIQVTPNGTPIILGPDGPTIGGYPKPYVVCQADLPKLAHLRTGQTVPLEMIQLETARIANIESGQQMDKFISELEIALTGDFQP